MGTINQNREHGKKSSSARNDNALPSDAVPDPVKLGAILSDVAQKAQPIIQKYIETCHCKDLSDQNLDPFNLREAWAEFLIALLNDPERLVRVQMEFWQKWFELAQDSALKFMGGPVTPSYHPVKGDRRFRDPAWQESVFFDFIKQSYLMTCDWLRQTLQSTKGLSDADIRKLEFFTRQFVDALSPSNFILTNPEVLKATLESGGENLLRGLENLMEDLERGGDRLKISTTDYDAFELGKNIATTPGSVVHQNALMQLIRYEPSTKTVYQKPLLIIPPWINKYYILDLRPDNSFVKWAVDQGHTVFVVSWVNPDKSHRNMMFEDYMKLGIVDALEQIEKETGQESCNVIGYCIGGTLLAMTLCWMEAKKCAHKVASATFLTTLIDFSEAGDLKVFVDDEQLALMNERMREKGVLEASALQTTFSLLRANDLIWSFVVNNYLLGKEPFPFDLLYWNDDSTNMPGALHKFYLTAMYRDNLLTKPGALKIDGVPIDIGNIRTPCYFLSTREDHIAPWQATYATTQMTQAPKVFTLAGSGHIAGVINPPSSGKYGYWTSEKTPRNPDHWLSEAKQEDGSWWTHWGQWIARRSGPKVSPDQHRKGILKVLEPAPGSYVRKRCV